MTENNLNKLIKNDVQPLNNAEPSIGNIKEIGGNKSIFPNICFVFALCLMIFANFHMFKSFDNWMAPLITFLLEMFIIEILSKLLKISEAPIIIQILLRLMKDKGLE